MITKTVTLRSTLQKISIFYLVPETESDIRFIHAYNRYIKSKYGDDSLEKQFVQDRQNRWCYGTPPIILQAPKAQKSKVTLK